MSDIQDLRVVITGGAAGIGAATASEFLTQGARVAVLDLTESPDEGVASFVCDITDEAATRAAIAAAAEALDGIDAIINNAGIGAQGTVEDGDLDIWRKVLDVNVVGIASVTRAALPYLRRSDRAAVVNMSSIVALVGLVQRAAYAASKGAVLALTKAMAADHVGEGIRVNGVAPGTVGTEWVGRLLANAADPVAERAALEGRQPMGRLVAPEDVAKAVVFLASPASGSVTGTCLSVDGGTAGIQLPRPAPAT
ncbi:SDR family NAD(P)-dependent oxidoreductase [Occultella gossypii]|uniref:SDR family oxidoreductase n=1 Tax=Occultella gossypii TaxID=2800820 RepID=A0ABS7SCN3_9MICO|nr:SDR family oxidoreductase [Occultella gossypii]MBZ2197454.1 SDR family oxidoreductase [Occultella gossypii]